MKKISGILLLALGSTTHAGGHPGDDIWDHIRALYRSVATLNTQIAAIPEGKQGIPGAQGVQGIAGIQGERGVKGDTGATGTAGPRGEPGTYTAGEGIAIEGNVIKTTQSLHYIGEEYHGGIIFYVDDTGHHGLIASKKDVTAQGVQWRNGSGGNKVTNARGDGLGAGETNTRLIIAQQTIDDQKGLFAALVATQFQVLEDGVTPCPTPNDSETLCYGGWYLPSAFELGLLYNALHQAHLVSFAPEFYWSSTEANVGNAWLQNFGTGDITASSKSNTIGRVRAINRF